jgi:hypothetical protein
VDVRLLAPRRFRLAQAITEFSVAQKREGIQVAVEP